jgi:hypothetical protein
MDIPNINDIKSIWMAPIELVPILPEEMEYIKSISDFLLNEHLPRIVSIVDKILMTEYNKRPNISLHNKLLIRNQVIYNINRNIKSYTMNLAKEMYDVQIASANEEIYIDVESI